MYKHKISNIFEFENIVLENKNKRLQSDLKTFGNMFIAKSIQIILQIKYNTYSKS